MAHAIVLSFQQSSDCTWVSKFEFKNVEKQSEISVILDKLALSLHRTSEITTQFCV